jgi:hypothetical protein
VFCSTFIDAKSGVVAPEVIVFDDRVQLDAMSGIQIITLAMIGTDYIGIGKSNCQAIKTTTAPDGEVNKAKVDGRKINV